MSYQVLARTWRPRTFSQIVGQQHVIRALTNGLLHDRLHHAFLFTGTRGVGKTSVARILAKALNCDSLKNGYDPCGACDVCQAIDQGRFIDLIEVDAASRTKVEDTRDLLDNVQYAPAQGRFKVYLIDEVHMLSAHSFNALLKTLEEPPAHVKFLLATTDPQKIPVTILSRCLQLNLKRLDIEQIQQQMQMILDKESIEYVPEALQLLANAADGSMRDGLSLLDQAIVHGAGQVGVDQVRDMLGWTAHQPILALLQALAEADVQQLLSIVEELHATAADFYYVLEQIIQRLHQLALTQFNAKIVDEANQNALKHLAETMTQEEIQLYYQTALMGQRDLNLAPSPKAGMEMVLLRMLAFRPVDIDQAVQLDSSKQVVPDKHIHITEAALPLEETRTWSTDNPLDGVEPVSQHFVAAESSPLQATTNSSVTAQQIDSDNDWEKILSRLQLAGLTKELASHCTLQSMSDGRCTLLLDPAHAHLQNDTAVNGLQQALYDKLDAKLKLIIKIETQQHESPAGKRERMSDERQQAAQQAIEQDDNVKALQQQFDATIIPGSVEPMDDTGEH
ncbi:MAG TPA: DNA polymerase III subunit gamma/tau [Crenotrichaceae bacterium]|nr:DNA polymerase III subunit gamma/tau [Crenotrichaceae bacterium]